MEQDLSRFKHLVTGMLNEVGRRAKGVFSGSTKRVSVGIILIRLIRAIISLLTLTFTARYFGVSMERDFWVLCTAAVTIMMQFLFGPINEIFRTQSVHIRAEEGDIALSRTNASISSLFVWVAFVVVLCIELYPGAVSHLIGAGIVGNDNVRFEFFIRLIVPSLIINQLVSGWICVLNGYNIFYIPEIYAIFSGVINIILIVLLTGRLGIGSLIISLYLTAIGLLLVLAREIRKQQPGPLVNVFPNYKFCKTLLIGAFPFYLSYFFGQLVTLIEKRISSGLGVGNASILDYAQKFVSLPQGVAMSTISTVLAPAMALHFARKEIIRLNEELVGYLRLILLGLTPVFIAFSVCSSEIITLLFSNKVTIPDQVLMGQVLCIYAIGLFGAIIYSAAGQALVAKRMGKVYAIGAVIAQIICGVANFLWGLKFGLRFIAFSWSVTYLMLGGGLLIIAGVTFKDIWSKFRTPMAILVLAFLGAKLTACALINSGDLTRIMLPELVGIGVVGTGLYVFHQPERKKLNDLFAKIRNIV
jgi:putative peptidoglycan lipid II flippase